MTNVNYIRQLTSVYEIFAEDDRLSPWHISLYYALFHSWNLSKFRNPISINRADMMLHSKIGSANTYSKCIKQLDQWGYIKYEPSKSAMRGSKVHMFIFDTSANTSSDTSADISSEQEPIHLVRPSINSINNKKHTKPNKQEKANSFRRTSPEREVQKGERQRKTAFSPPSLDEAKKFFLEAKSTHDQAEQFYNHFESNGWLVGGKAKMKNWKAAARNWIKRSSKFNPSQNDRLHTEQNKDYSIPL